jgi:hypothetical protein
LLREGGEFDDYFLNFLKPQKYSLLGARASCAPASQLINAEIYRPLAQKVAGRDDIVGELSVSGGFAALMCGESLTHRRHVSFYFAATPLIGGVAAR